MTVNPKEAQICMEWTRPKEKAGTKPVLQAGQVSKIFMGPGGNKIYTDTMFPLRGGSLKSIVCMDRGILGKAGQNEEPTMDLGGGFNG